MNRQIDSTQPDLPSVLRILQMLDGDRQELGDLQSLAEQILPYVQRARLAATSLEETVAKITSHYLRDGLRVQHLQGDSASPAWEQVLEQVLEFATKHSLYPRDTEATSWPDLDAYADIQRNLHTYNFEGSLDHWITVTVVNRLRRYWRDRKSLSAGGPGFRSKAERDADGADSDPEPPKMAVLSLDQLPESSRPIVGRQEDDPMSVVRDVEEIELRRMTADAVQQLAACKQDELLPLIWYAVAERGWRLREVADILDLTVSQVHRRIEQIRMYLRQHRDVQQWLYAAD